jgi:hypothetical protein
VSTNFLKLADGVDVTPLRLELARQPELWNRNDARLKPWMPHHETDDIWLRYKDETENIASGSYANFADAHWPIWYPAYYSLPSTRRLIFDLMARVEGEALGGVLIYRVPPGKQIYPHTDKGWHADYYEKFNITIESNSQSAFYYPDHNEAMLSRMGDAFWFKNTVSHGVKNDGVTDHIVMTVCIKTHAFKG